MLGSNQTAEGSPSLEPHTEVSNLLVSRKSGGRRFVCCGASLAGVYSGDEVQAGEQLHDTKVSWKQKLPEIFARYYVKLLTKM